MKFSIFKYYFSVLLFENYLKKVFKSHNNLSSYKIEIIFFFFKLIFCFTIQFLTMIGC